MSTPLIVLLVVIILLGGGWGWYGYRGAAWGAAGPGYPDVVGLLVFVLVVVLVIYLLRGVL
jgi:hypothetical protein